MFLVVAVVIVRNIYKIKDKAARSLLPCRSKGVLYIGSIAKCRTSFGNRISAFCNLFDKFAFDKLRKLSPNVFFTVEVAFLLFRYRSGTKLVDKFAYGKICGAEIVDNAREPKVHLAIGLAWFAGHRLTPMRIAQTAV